MTAVPALVEAPNQEPLRRSARRLPTKEMSSKGATQPFPVGDCDSKPTWAASAPRSKYRTKDHASPSVEAWKAYARPSRETRSQTVLPVTMNPFESSEERRVTTETIIGAPSGERSKHSLAQRVSSAQTSSTPASYVDANPT